MDDKGHSGTAQSSQGHPQRRDVTPPGRLRPGVWSSQARREGRPRQRPSALTCPGPSTWAPSSEEAAQASQEPRHQGVGRWEAFHRVNKSRAREHHSELL